MKEQLKQLKKKICQRLQPKARKGWLNLGDIASQGGWVGKVVAIFANIASASLSAAFVPVFEGMAKLAMLIFSGVIKVLVAVLVSVAQYNYFIKELAVVEAWGILRDIGNMFFIILFLVMAVGTILKKEQYSWQKMLIPIVLVAIFINFSRTICGLFIDFSQVIMLTFVNAFRDIAGGNLIQLLGLDDFLAWESLKSGSGFEEGGINAFQVLAVLYLGVLVSFIALIIFSIVVIILILRIIALWFLVVLSPIAFIFYIFPGTQQYAKKWQDMFFKNVISGPVIAFFIWFAFLVMEKSEKVSIINQADVPEGSVVFPVLGKPDFYIKFILGGGLLIGSLVAAKQLGGVGASLAGKGVSFLQKAGTAAAKKVGKVASYYPKEWGKKVGYAAADRGLRSLIGAPIVGRMAGKKLGELRAKRQGEEEKAARPYQYLEDHEMGHLLRGTLRGTARGARGGRFFRFFQTEAGRKFELALSKQAWQKKQDWGDLGQSVGISREDLAQRAGEADNVYAARVHPLWDQIRNGPIRQLIERYGQLTGRHLTPENNDVARDLASWMHYEIWRFNNLHLVPDNMQRIDPTTGIQFPGMGGYEHTYGVSRQPTSARAAESHQPYSTDPIRGTQILEARIQNIYDDIQTRVTAGITPDQRQMQYLFREIMQGLVGGSTERRIGMVRALAGVNPAVLNQRFRYQPTAGVTADISIREALEQARTAPSYGDQKRLKATRELYDEHGEDYINLPQYKQNREKYLNLEEFKTIQNSASTNEKTTNLTTNNDVITGFGRTIEQGQTAKEKGATSYEAARVAIDYDKLDFKAANIDEQMKNAPAIGLMGKAKEEIINQICEILKNQGKVPEEIEKFRESANMADELDIIKKGISLTEAKRALAHEKVHRKVDSLPVEVLDRTWSTLDEGEKKGAEKQFEKTYGRKPRHLRELQAERLVEGLTSETPWAEKDEKGKKTGIQLYNKEKEALTAATGLTIANLTSNLTGRPMVGGTEERFPLSEVVRAAQGGSTEGLTPELLAALTKLGDNLKEVGGGLAVVGKLGGSIKDLQNTISATAMKTGMDNMRMAWVVRENTATWKKANDSLAGLEKKYQQK